MLPVCISVSSHSVFIPVLLDFMSDGSFVSQSFVSFLAFLVVPPAHPVLVKALDDNTLSNTRVTFTIPLKLSVSPCHVEFWFSPYP